MKTKGIGKYRLILIKQSKPWKNKENFDEIMELALSFACQKIVTIAFCPSQDPTREGN